MKKIYVTTLILALTICVQAQEPSAATKDAPAKDAPAKDAPAKDATAQETQPTLEETTRWIAARMEAAGGYVTTLPSGSVERRRLEGVTFDGCALKFKDTLILQAAMTNYAGAVIELSLSLADLDGDSARVALLNGHRFVDIATRDGKKKIKSDASIRIMSSRTNESKMTNQISIPVETAETAERVRKAFVYAIEICGRIKEPF